MDPHPPHLHASARLMSLLVLGIQLSDGEVQDDHHFLTLVNLIKQNMRIEQSLQATRQTRSGSPRTHVLPVFEEALFRGREMHGRFLNYHSAVALPIPARTVESSLKNKISRMAWIGRYENLTHSHGRTPQRAPYQKSRRFDHINKDSYSPKLRCLH